MGTKDKGYQVNLEAAVEVYSDMVYRISMTIAKNTDDAKDIFQEVFLRLVRYQADIQSEEHLKAWLIRVTSNCAKTFVSNAWNRMTQGMMSDEDAVAKDNPMEQNELLKELHHLPEKFSLTLYLHYYEGYSVKEIAQILDKSENTIKTLLARGRTRLKKHLEEGGYIL